ncbi:Uncharacterized protein dnm_038080 [Desulfonema magnum]|uniref:Uncharacterized protein n=1 Tax=Desulfonema magnum TaxID=45655 RepID=A0A975BLQ9_9BACT|nr:Uncharacterized protein dnm_038080 [Desulfonema magnum]
MVICLISDNYINYQYENICPCPSSVGTACLQNMPSPAGLGNTGPVIATNMPSLRDFSNPL